MGLLEEKLKSYQDFPKEGILFRDVFSWFKDPDCLRELSKKFSEAVKAKGWDKVDIIVGLESRGFLFGPILALEFGAGFVPVRKLGKLPGELESVSYVLEYRSDTFEIQKDSILPGQKVLIVDDLLATGGSLKASCELVERLQGEVVGSVVAIELEDLKGREKIPTEVHCLFKF